MDYSPTQRAILIDLLVSGDDKAENIGRRTGYHRNSLSRSFNQLLDKSLVAEKGGGVYRLTEDGATVGRELIKSGHNPYLTDEEETG